MCFKLSALYRVSNRVLMLLNGTQDLRTGIMKGHWEQISAPLISTSVRKINFGKIPYNPDEDAVTTFTISGKDLQGDVEIYGPSYGFAISLDGVNYVSSSPPLLISLASSGDTDIPETTIYAKMYGFNQMGETTGKIKIYTRGTPRVYIDLVGTILYSLPELNNVSLSTLDRTSVYANINVINAGGEDCIAHGVCWGTSANPTVAGLHTDEGTDFVSQSYISGLLPGYTYHVRSYIQNSKGISYSPDLEFTTLSYDVGESYEGGKVAYIFEEGDYGYVAGQWHGIICTNNDLGGTYKFDSHASVYKLPEANNKVEIGYAILNDQWLFGLFDFTVPATFACHNLEEGGKSDWVLPTKEDLIKLYDNRVAIEEFGADIYWSSSQVDDTHSWSVNFDTGAVLSTELNSSSHLVRAIRYF